MKSRSNFKVKVTRSKSRSQLKGLITRNIHVKYESPTTYGSRDIAKVKVFVTDRRMDRQTNRQTHRQTNR